MSETQNSLPDIFSAYNYAKDQNCQPSRPSYYNHFPVSYGTMMARVRKQNLLLYLLFYRWWFLYSAPKEIRKEIRQTLQLDWNENWEYLVQCFPFLLFLWIILYFFFQISVHILTLPIKVIMRIWKGREFTAI